MKPDLAHSRPKAVRDITSAEFDGEVVAYSPGPGKGYHLNDTAAWLWRQCDGRRNVDELVDLMRQQFDCGDTDVRPDVEKALRDLASSGLVELEAGANGVV